MRVCPTLEGTAAVPLITHRVSGSDCLSRQSCNYHKCHRCVFRGQSADWQLGEAASTHHAPGTNGVAHGVKAPERAPDRPVEVPRPQDAPARQPLGA